MRIFELISFLVVTFMLVRVNGECDQCKHNNPIACHGETVYSLCVNGKPTYDNITCPSGFVCTGDVFLCLPSEMVTPICTRRATVSATSNKCGICGSARKVFACLNRTTIAFCFGEDDPYYESLSYCPEGTVCDLNSGANFCTDQRLVEPSCPKDEWSLPTTVSVTTDSTSTKQTATTTAPTSKETTIIFQQTTTPEATTNSLPTIIVIEPTIITPEMTVPTLDITTPTPELSASDPTKSISAPTTTVLITDASLLTSTTYLTTTTKSETSEQSAADTNIPTTPLVSTTKAEPTRTLETTTIPTTTATPLITTPAATTELITTSTVTITVLPTILTTSGSTETQTITSQNSLTTTFQTTTTFSPTTATVQHLTPLEICEQNSIEARTSFFGLPGDVTCKNYIMCLQIGSYWSAVQRSCTTNKWFDLVLGKCSESYNCPSTNVSVTGTTQTATTQPTTTTVLPKTTKQLTTTMQDISTPLEVCEQNALERQTAFFDSPGDTTCKKYIVCTKVGSSWKVQERKCSSNKWFDPVAAKCSESYRCFSTIQL
ncbi:uncharacterized protein [Eurosta solidaginis]|uniref:uncharacterized protein isoform X6 n=1 Tax=Eurosta solidaginis TaxID=178769 RepID=UPI0035309A37